MPTSARITALLILLAGCGVTSVRVFFALSTTGATSTNAVLNVSYPVH